MAIDAYLQIDGIKGESADSAHQGWIEITSAHWGVTQPRSATVSTAGGHIQIEREWQAIDDRKFGIGNISLAEGRKYEHATHQAGIKMDIRPVRKDMMTGQAARCSRFDAVYDRDATVKPLHLFLRHPMVSKIFFNDDKVQIACGGKVRSLRGHDDHIHIEIWKWNLWT
jgi:hypothetical protein